MKNQFTHIICMFIHVSLKAIALIVFIQSALPIRTFAQGKYVEAYIVTNQNDTIQGQIKDEEWKESPRAIQFRGSGGALDQKFSAVGIKGFKLVPSNEIYQSKRIGLLNITLTQTYAKNPSMETRDSSQVFLQQIVAGKQASLYLYLDALEKSHYYIEKGNLVKELYNYPFHKKIDNRTYLLVYDQYKNQLARFTRDTRGFNDSIPLYQETYLKQYIENYNRSFLDSGEIYKAENKGLTFDIDVNAGLESWNERPVIVDNEPTFGIGIRMSFPRKFRNRYLKVNFFLTPHVLIDYGQTSNQKVSLKTVELVIGRYMGAGKLRPYIGYQFSSAYHGRRSDFLGLQAGISYNRRINLEIGHFANFYAVISETRFFTPPRISLHYMIGLNSMRSRRQR